MRRYFRILLAIAAHDLAREARRPVAAGAVLLFGLCSLVVLRISLAGSSMPSASVLAGTLWILLVFAALLGTARAWSAEREDGSYDALLTAPAPRTAIHLGKVLYAFVVTLVLHAILAFLHLAVFAAPEKTSALLALCAAIVLADLGFAAVGVMVAGIGLSAKSRDLIGPVLFLPLAIPLVIASVSLALDTYQGDLSSTFDTLLFLLVYDLVFIGAGVAAFPELAVE